MVPTMPRCAGPRAPTVYRARLARHIARAIDAAGGWLPFDRFMALALYAPGLGYYARGEPPVRRAAGVGQRLRHRARADAAVRPRAGAAGGAGAATRAAPTRCWEFGAGSGALAAAAARRAGRARAALHASSICRARCARASASASRASATGALARRAGPTRCDGVVVGNEVLDAMPVQLLHWDGAALARARRASATRRRASRGADRADRAAPAARRAAFAPGTRDRDPPAGRGLRRHAGRALQRGAAFFIDYGFPAGRVLPPAAHRRHADVPPRATAPTPTRWPTWATRTSPRMSTSPASRWPAQDAGLRRAGLHVAGALPDELRPARRLAWRRRARAGGGAEADHRARDGRAVQGDRLRQGLHASTRSASRPATARIGCDRDALAARSSCSRSSCSAALRLAREDRPRPAARRLSLSPGGREWHVPLASSVLLSVVAMLIAKIL